ncbi:hypothetical protein Sango_0953700 [Sesamum angolense]|uniref:Uncharacterized protein n=1 Tax=Sesamum angolense TaxID=2727404 RepID=A0AAE1WYN3_9LAMI|nr:hypothetical protein Sango_0953700 [Sesamum angolense]
MILNSSDAVMFMVFFSYVTICQLSTSSGSPAYGTLISGLIIGYWPLNLGSAFYLGTAALPTKSSAEKCRLLVGEEAASKSGQFTFLNCFDGSSGTLACVVKEGVKLYFYNFRALHVESKRNVAIETALADSIAQGMSAADAAKVAQKKEPRQQN